MVIEHLKRLNYSFAPVNLYFWRTYEKQEIDLVEERGGKLHGREFKWSQPKLVSPPKDWISTYSNADYKVITRENYLETLIP